MAPTLALALGVSADDLTDIYADDEEDKGSPWVRAGRSAVPPSPRLLATGSTGRERRSGSSGGPCCPWCGVAIPLRPHSHLCCRSAHREVIVTLRCSQHGGGLREHTKGAPRDMACPYAIMETDGSPNA